MKNENQHKPGLSAEALAKAGYKKTKLGWIPEEWEVISIKDIADKSVKWSITGGPFGSNLKVEHYTEQGVRVIQLQNIGDGSFIDDYKLYTSNEKADELKSCIIYPGEIILSKMGDPVARACFIPNNENRYLMASDGIRLVPDKTKFDFSFVKEYINWKIFRSIAIKASTGTTRQRIGLDDLKKLPFLFIPLPEQQKIAQILTTWDKAIGKTENLTAKKQARKKSLMQQLLKGKVRFKDFSKYKWQNKILDEIVEFSNGKAHENIISENGQYVLITSKFIATSGKEFRKVTDMLTPLMVNDIVMVMSDVPKGKALAKCHLIDENNRYTLNQRICLLRADEVDPKYLYYRINRNPYFLQFDSGVGQTNLKKDEILECPIQLPTLIEQQKIASVLSAADKEIETLQKQLEKLKEQKRGLMQKLLTGEIRVKLK
jgi:type I restriction enzyme S subunit